MVYFAYLGKEYGIAKSVVVILGGTIVGLGCHSYFNSAWVRKEVYQICDEIQTQNISDAKCPSIILEKVFVILTIFIFTLSTLLLMGNLFSRQLSEGFFKTGDIIYSGVSGLIVIIVGSLFIYSAVSIDNLFTTLISISDTINCTISVALSDDSKYQLYPEKIAAGSLSIIQGLVYFAVAGLLLLR